MSKSIHEMMIDIGIYKELFVVVFSFDFMDVMKE
jgi:hypothetical protein